jgi:hypothetical protein
MTVFRTKIVEYSAKGEVWLETTTNGLLIFIRGCNVNKQGKEEPVGMIDLYYASDAGHVHDNALACLVTFNGSEEIAQTKYYEDRTDHQVFAPEVSRLRSSQLWRTPVKGVLPKPA